MFHLGLFKIRCDQIWKHFKIKNQFKLDNNLYFLGFKIERFDCIFIPILLYPITCFGKYIITI